jgi:tRNA U34 5-methylaminomethyl-2-thiouridine-forming methyltransferase MnmC
MDHTGSLHVSTFEYLKPTPQQMEVMTELRQQFSDFASMLDRVIPGGPDKTYLLRKLREVAMWANIAITRNPDGSPRC